MRQSYASRAAAGQTFHSNAQGGAVASQQPPSIPSTQPKQARPQLPPDMNSPRHENRPPSPAHIPRTNAPESEVYVLTFLTDTKHHDILTGMRKKYFPPKLNKLDAHLTLFHALPGSKLEDEILPVLQDVAGSTRQFQILAATPFRLRKGIAIGVPKSHGGEDARTVHSKLKCQWQSFLSDQDAGGFAAHYTIMNKVDDGKEVDKAFQDVEEQWKPCGGTAMGLSLWRYERGYWKWQSNFDFIK